MWQIAPTLFLGDRTDARDENRLRRAGVTHVVNCSKELPCHFEGKFVYLWLKLEDPDPAFRARMPEACRFIRAGCREVKVLVHCTGAVSRSPAVILAYFCSQGDKLHQAVRRLGRLVPTGIDELFLRHLAEAEGIELTRAEVDRLQDMLLGRP